MTTALLRVSVGSALIAVLLQRPEAVAQGSGQASQFDRRYLRPDGTAPDEHPEFYFTRAAYTGYWSRNWAIDYPKADRQLMTGVRRLLTHLDASPDEHPVRLDDPDLNRFPFLYAVEVGRMALTEPEVAGLRRYLQAGGFLVVDDFWGTREWANFESEIRQVLPGCTIVDLPRDHPVFSAFYDIKEFYQVPNVGNAQTGRTWEKDGFVPY